MLVLINTNENKSITVDELGATKKIEKVIAMVQVKADGLYARGTGFVTDPATEKQKPYHSFDFGKITGYTDATLLTKFTEKVTTSLPEGFEIQTS